MATAPQFTSVPNAALSRISAANTARDGSGSLVDSFTAGASGSRIDSIVFTSAQASVGASAARVQRVALTDTSGINPRLIAEVAMTAVTSSNTAIGATQTIIFTNGLVIKSGQLIKTWQSIYGSAADQTDVLVKGGDF